MSDNQGKQITSAFLYLQQVFQESQRLIFKLDSQLEPEWKNLYGNRITRDVSSSLQEPLSWLPESIFRMYENDKDKSVNIGITISYWGDKIDQPIITAGKILYDDINKRGHWDLWYIWFEYAVKDEENKFEFDGKINNYHPKENNHIKEAKMFSLPLVSITDDATLIEKIINPLKVL